MSSAAPQTHAQGPRGPRLIDIGHQVLDAAPAGCRLIVNSFTGESRAHPQHQAIPPGWYGLGISIKEAQRCAA